MAELRYDPNEVREREKEATRRLEEEMRAVAIEGDADGLSLTIDGYGDLSRLAIAPELLRRGDFAEVLVSRLNEAMAKARPLATWRGFHVPSGDLRSYRLLWELEEHRCGKDASWNWFPYDVGDVELMAGLWYFWRQQPITLGDLADAARLDPQLLTDVATGAFPSPDEMWEHELEWIRQDLGRALGGALGVTPKDLIDQGVAICFPIDVANCAVILGESDREESFRATIFGVRYGEATAQALRHYRELYGGAGPLETVSNAMEAGALRIDFPEPAVYPHTPLKSRWGIDYMSYPNPKAVVYAELLQDELGLPLDELHRRSREARMKKCGEVASGTDLTAMVYNRTDREGAFDAYLGMEQMVEDILGLDRVNEADASKVVGKGHGEREERAEAFLIPESREAYARYFLEEGPRIHLTSRNGRPWDEVEKALRV